MRKQFVKYLMVLFFLQGSINVNAQKDTINRSNPYWVNINSGYNNELGYLGFTGVYSPRVFSHKLNAIGGFGFNRFQIMSKIGLETGNLFNKRVSPVIGSAYAFSLISGNLSTNDTNMFMVKSNNYISLYLGLRFYSKNKQVSFDLKVGELIMLNPPNVIVLWGNVNKKSVEESLRGGCLISLGISVNFQKPKEI